MNRTPRSAGFTLIEILVVVAVLGFVTAIVLLRGPVRSAGLEARGAAREMAQALRLARARAITTDRPVTFTLDAAGHGFRIGDGPAQALPSGMSAALTTPAGIIFEPDGSANGGAVALAGGRERMSIEVDWLTGRVSVLPRR